MAPGVISVIYPGDAKFDMEYYLKSHMPLVMAKWGKYGLKGYKVAQYDKGAEYSVQAWLEWEDESNLAKAFEGPETKEILGDIPNYSDKNGILANGKIVHAA